VQFDPAIAAQVSFKRAEVLGELGQDLEDTREAEEIFSGSAGSEAKSAYYRLQEIGERHSDAVSFQQFLIYITWQQVTEETIRSHFQRGAELCDRYLKQFASRDEMQTRQIKELRQSFRAGLGLDVDDEADYDKDSFKGGD
jgi:hypothetical protein